MHTIWFVWLEGSEQKTSRENDDVVKRNEGCADKKVVCGITNVWDGAIFWRLWNGSSVV